ncbi:MAG: hypothetical protein GX488_10080 [Clostridiales bacterium]|nr:hypothetical protein [Clostridiales bacterium]
MDGIKKITDRIAAETREEIAAMQAETAEKCRSIKEYYDKIAQEEYWKAVTAGAQECEIQAQRLSSTAVMESKKSILAMKQETVSRIFEEAEKRICNLPEDRYVDFLARLAGNAISTGLEEVVFNERDKAQYSKAVIKAANEIAKKRGLLPKLTVSEITGDFKGGIVVRQGDIEVNCTVEKLIELSKGEIAAQVADILFSE